MKPVNVKLQLKKHKEWQARYEKEFVRLWRRLGKYIAKEAYKKTKQPSWFGGRRASAKEQARDDFEAMQVKV
jgi:hypothetical protein